MSMPYYLSPGREWFLASLFHLFIMFSVYQIENSFLIADKLSVSEDGEH
jgi:hypothetical protein